MRPIVEGMCLMESAMNGSLTLCDFADMNDALDVRAENQHRRDSAVAARR